MEIKIKPEEENLIKELPITKTISFTDEDWNIIKENAETKFKSFDWIWGRNPYTKITEANMMIEIENGIVINCNDSRLIGQQYTGVPFAA